MPPDPSRVRRLLHWALVFAGLFAYFLTIQLRAENLAGVDVFFHIKLARLMAEQGLIRELPWMQFAVFREHWVDHHFLFHVLLIPFALGDLVLGAKVAAATFAAAALTAFTIFLHRRRAHAPVFWLLLLLASSAPFLYRMNMLRAQSLAILFFLVFLDALFERRSRLAFVSGLLFVWAYQLFVLLVPMAAAVAIAGFRDRRRPEVRAPIFGLLGIITGLVVNPFFPHNILFLHQHVVVKVINRAGLGVGGEWSPFDAWFIISGNVPIYIALGVVAVLLLLRPGRIGRVSLALAAIAAMFFLMHMRSRRFIEYWPPFALAFAASAISDLIPWERIRQARFFRPGAAVLALLLVVLAVRNHGTAVRDIDSNLAPDRYRGGADWLAAHSEPGEVVFTTDWDDFAELFFHNHHNTYLVGLDPTFMLLYDRTLFHQWDQIASGRVVGAAPVIRRDYGARYVFTDLAHTAFIELADSDPDYRRVFGDHGCIVYEIAEGLDLDHLRVEGETRYPPPRTGGSRCRIQNLAQEFGITCSNNRHLFYQATASGDFFELEVRFGRPGRYAVRAGLVMSDDYGIVQVLVDGLPLGVPFDAHSARVGTAERINLGKITLEAGIHAVRLEVIGKNPDSRGYFAGLDYLDFEYLRSEGPGDPPASATNLPRP